MAEFKRSEGTVEPPARQAEPAIQRHIELVAPTPAALPTPNAPTLAAFAPNRAVQRQVAGPVLQAAGHLQDLKVQRQTEQTALQRQMAEVQASLPAGTEQAAVQRQPDQSQPASLPAAFQRQASGRGPGQAPGIGDWAGLYAHEMGRQVPDQQGMYPSGPVKALQRLVATGLAQSARTSNLPPVQRYAELGQALATIQRQPLGASTVTGSLGQMLPGERPVIQRALMEANLALQRQEAEDAQVEQLHSLQRQLAKHQAQSDQARVIQRIKERQGRGDPLPAAVQRHMEQGLNTDLSGVRIHTDSEAHLLSKKAGATAFTSGKDIYFQRSKFDPNSRSGLELLGHELTHVKQQGEGRVGGGIDPDAGLEQQAQHMGARLASAGPVAQHPRAPTAPTATFSPRTLQRAPNSPNTPGPTNTPGASGPAPRGNMNRRHVLDNLDFYKGTHSGNSYLLRPITDPEVQKLYQEALKQGVRDGAVTLSNGQTWYVRQADGKFHPMSGPGIINLTQQEVAFFRILKAQKGNAEQAFENIAKAMRGQKYAMSAEMEIALQHVGQKLGLTEAVIRRIFSGATSAAAQAARTPPAPHSQPGPPAPPPGPQGPAAGPAPQPHPAQAPPTSGQVSAAQAERAGGAVEHPTPEMLSAARARAAGRAFKLVRWGGRVLLLVAVAADSYEIYQSHFSPKVIAKKAGGWAGGAAASSVAAEAASPLLAGGPWGWAGYAVIVGGAGVGGYFAGEQITETIYEWGFEK